DEVKMRLIPVRIGNNVDGDDQSELTRHLQGLQILIESDTLAVQSQRLIVQRLGGKKHVQESQTLPIGEDLTIAEYHVTTRLQIIPLPDPALFYGPPDRHAVLRMDERHVIDNKHVGLADPCEVFHDGFWGAVPIATTIKGPGAAEGAVPRTATRELNRSGRS